MYVHRCVYRNPNLYPSGSVPSDTTLNYDNSQIVASMRFQFSDILHPSGSVTSDTYTTKQILSKNSYPILNGPKPASFNLLNTRSSNQFPFSTELAILYVKNKFSNSNIKHN